MRSTEGWHAMEHPACHRSNDYIHSSLPRTLQSMKNAVQTARPALLMSAISERRHNVALHGSKTHHLHLP